MTTVVIILLGDLLSLLLLIGIFAPKPEPAVVEGGVGTALVGGKATWYDNGSGLYGAAGPVLREALGGDPAFRGQTVRVCADECVLVRLTDWCACGDRGGVPTLIDLSPDAFARLAPLSAGVIDVTIELGGVVLPATDTEGVQ
jgi:hypothetical protein